MKTFNATLGAALAMGAVLLTGAGTPAFAAASRTTDAFLSIATVDVDFLDRSSRLALDNSKNARLRTFAHDEAREQTLTANAMDAWIDADKAKTVVASADDPVVTGRSVAVDAPAPAAATMPLLVGQEDLDALYGLTGIEFDDMYKAKQAEALTQLQGLYKDYAANGDDPALQAMAMRELPKINKRIAELRKL